MGYEYKAKIIDVSGNKAVMKINLGFGTWRKQEVTIHGFKNAPYGKSKEQIAQLLETQETFFIRSFKEKDRFNVVLFDEEKYVDRYLYNANLIKVVDGDTIDVDIDLGFNTWREDRVRLYGLDAPESRTRNLIEKEAGLLVKDYLIKQLTANEFSLKTSVDSDKYGRYLATILIGDISLNQLMIDLGYAKKYDGGGKDEWGNDELLKISRELG